MELLFEFITELIGEIIIDTIKNDKVSLWLRIPLLILFSIAALAIILLLAYVGFKLINESIFVSIFFLLLALLFLGFYSIFIYKLIKK